VVPTRIAQARSGLDPTCRQPTTGQTWEVKEKGYFANYERARRKVSKKPEEKAKNLRT
jgi:hypothetical protein